MNKLTLRVLNPKRFNVIYMFDGKALKPKGDNMGHFVFNIETEKDHVDVLIIRRSPLRSKVWVLWQLLIFIFSIFGLFDLRSKKLHEEAVYSATIFVKGDGEADLKFDTDPAKKMFVELATQLKIDEKENAIIIDPPIKRRAKKAKVLKIFTFIILLALVIVLVLLI